MMPKKIELFKGLPIIKEDNNTILVDTGNPSTIHCSNQLTFCNKQYNVTTSYMGLTIDKLSELLGTGISTLLGADILKDFIVFIDYENNEMSFLDNGGKKENYNELLIDIFMGIPIVEIDISGVKAKCFLDTGAKLSYLNNAVTAQFDKSGIEEDFFPSYGRFETNVYQINTLFGGNNVLIKYGNLPSLLQMSLTLANVQGIIGFDFFCNFKVYLDYNSRKIYYLKIKM